MKQEGQALDKKAREYIGYEYKEVETDEAWFSFLADGYENFGWQMDENMPQSETNVHRQYSGGMGSTKMVLRLKRNRKIINKMELTRLQRNFEACVAEIRHLEKEKSSLPTMRSLIVGIIGTAFMAGATFAVTASPPHIALCIILAVPGFLGWILPYFLYRRGVQQQSEKLTPLIEEKYDEIYKICEKGNKLLNE